MDLKDSTHTKLMSVYQKYGLQVTLKVAYNLLVKQPQVPSISFKTTLNGEVCETVLEILVCDYCRQNRERTRDWCWQKGIILTDPTKKQSSFLTEIDFTLFTPQCIYLFECKSYAGKKILVDDGTIVRENGSEFDVFRQSLLHVETLDKWLANTSTNPVYQLVMFDFSRGELTDTRGAKERKLMPLVNENTLFSALIEGPVVWDCEYLKKVVAVFEKASPRLRRRHLEYVKGLKEGRRD